MIRSISIIFSFLFLLSCSTEEAKHKKMLRDIDKSFRTYITNNDLKKDFRTSLKSVRVLSYVEEANEEEKYKAEIVMKGTTVLAGSSRVYNMNDTVTCYFDENLRMLRFVNSREN